VAIVAGRQGDCYILPILEGSASIARDCKRDIYSRFLHINIHSIQFIHIHFNIYIYTTIHSCISVITSYHLHTFNRLLLHLIIVYPLLVCILLLLYVYICVSSCSIAWFPSIVPVGFSSGWGPPPYTIQAISAILYALNLIYYISKLRGD
jgi:hypothetical protein